jgi:hypothetical protein
MIRVRDWLTLNRVRDWLSLNLGVDYWSLDRWKDCWSLDRGWDYWSLDGEWNSLDLCRLQEGLTLDRLSVRSSVQLVFWVLVDWGKLPQELSVAESDPPAAIRPNLILPIGQDSNNNTTFVPSPGIVSCLVLYHHMVAQVEWGVFFDLAGQVLLVLGGPLGQGQLPPLGHLLPRV